MQKGAKGGRPERRHEPFSSRLRMKSRTCALPACVELMKAVSSAQKQSALGESQGRR